MSDPSRFVSRFRNGVTVQIGKRPYADKPFHLYFNAWTHGLALVVWARGRYWVRFTRNWGEF